MIAKIGIIALVGMCFVMSGFLGIASGAVTVTEPEISMNMIGEWRAIDTSEGDFVGHGIAIINVVNHSRLVAFWAQNVTRGDARTRVTVGKDGSYVEFGIEERETRLIMGISPLWNQTLEIYIQSEDKCCFEIWGLVEPGVVWRNGAWEIDNSAQETEEVLLATIIR